MVLLWHNIDERENNIWGNIRLVTFAAVQRYIIDAVVYKYGVQLAKKAFLIAVKYFAYNGSLKLPCFHLSRTGCYFRWNKNRDLSAFSCSWQRTFTEMTDVQSAEIADFFRVAFPLASSSSSSRQRAAMSSFALTVAIRLRFRKRTRRTTGADHPQRTFHV